MRLNNHRGVGTLSALACAAGLSCTITHARAGISVSGTAAGGAPVMTCSEMWTYDTGASQSLMSRRCAMMLGLLNGAGMPVGANGARMFNNGEVDTWCYDGIAIAATDNFGNICVSSTTVYVSKANDSWAGSNLLGRDWRKAVKGQWDDETEKVRWPKAAVAPAKPAVPTTDGAGGGIKSVYENIRLFGNASTTLLGMTFMTGSAFSFIPQHTALELNAIPVGTINLLTADLDTYAGLAIAEQNLTHQSVFQIVQVNGFDFGLGPGGGSRQFLVSNNANSQFGIMGRDFFSGMVGNQQYMHHMDYNDLGDEAIEFGLVPAPSTVAIFVLSGAGVIARRRR